jgi:translation initiation factor 5A
MSDDETFENTHAGAAGCVPKQAGEVKKGSYIMLKGHPCKVVDYSTSKTGKHGHAKAHIVGIDIFTGKKCEDLCPTSHNMSEPIVKKFEYTVMDVSDEGALSLLTAEGEPKDDLNLPTGTDDLDKIAIEIKKMFADGKGIRVTTMTAIGQECVCGVTEDK